jgi:hypothetical protein
MLAGHMREAHSRSHVSMLDQLISFLPEKVIISG